MVFIIFKFPSPSPPLSKILRTLLFTIVPASSNKQVPRIPTITEFQGSTDLAHIANDDEPIVCGLHINREYLGTLSGQLKALQLILGVPTLYLAVTIFHAFPELLWIIYLAVVVWALTQ